MHDENQPEVPLSEVPRQVADLERACADLEVGVKNIAKILHWLMGASTLLTGIALGMALCNLLKG